MILQVPITEAVSLIKRKTGKAVSMKVVNNSTINVGYQINVKVPLLGHISKNVHMDVTIDKIENNDVFLHYSMRMPGADTVVNTLLAFFANDIHIVERCDNSCLVIHLYEIEEARKVLDKIDINSVTFDDNAALVQFDVK